MTRTEVTDATDRPTLSRRHAEGAVNARSLLFTVLGEFVLPLGGAAWTSAFIRTFAALGVEEKTTRQALMRTSADGWLRAERVGRRTRWHLTEAAEQLLTAGAQRIYSFKGYAEEWDGRWLLVAARVPDSDRKGRHLLRTRLRWVGLGSLAPAIWISPHPERADEAARVLEVAGATEAQVFLAERTSFGDARQMVNAAWDLVSIEADYDRFRAQFSDAATGTHPDRPRDPLPHEITGVPVGNGPAGAASRQIQLVHRWRRFPLLDPALPRELLPSTWSGVAAAELFTSAHTAWHAAGVLGWRALDDADN